MTVNSVSSLFVFVGCIFMLASIFASMKTHTLTPGVFQKKWLAMTCFMFFFLVGYVAFLIILVAGLDLPLELITAMVFLAGAVFVYVVMSLARHSFERTGHTENLLSRANADLLQKNTELHLEIAARRTAETALQKNHDELEVQIRQRTQDLTSALDELKQEIATRKQTESELKFSYNEMNQIFNSTSDGMAVIDADFNVMRVNDRLLSFLGIRAEEASNKKCYTVCSEHPCHTPDCFLTLIKEGNEKVEREMIFSGPDGEQTPFLVTATPFRDQDGRLVGIVQNFKDIAERKQMEERLREISMKDELTGLLNRRGFVMKASQQLKLAGRTHDDLFLLYADLDNMKLINDNFGHEAGDQLLVETASVFREAFRDSDIIARIGGDEFAGLLISPSGGDHANAIRRRFEKTLEEHNKRRDRSYDISISTGLVRYDPMNPCSTEELLTHADMLMYECKNEKKNPSSAFAEEFRQTGTGPPCVRVKEPNRC